MTPDDVLLRLTELFREVLGDDTLVLTPETTAPDVPGWDSMAHISIVVEAERRFGIRIKTAEIERLRNVGDFMTLIAAKAA